MKQYIIVLTLSCSLSTNALNAFDLFGLFKGHKDETPEQAVERLTTQQVAHPKDPFVNYNLGVAQYKINNFAHAAGNFQRSAKHSKTKKDLRQRAYFNGANSLYKDTLTQLPSSWESDDAIVENIDTHIKTLKQAIKNYSSALKIDKHNSRAHANKKRVEELLKKLEEKKKQQKEKQKKDDQQDQNKDSKNDDSSDNKDDKSSKSKNKQKNNSNQTKNDNQSQSQKDDQQDNQQNGESDKPEKSRKDTPDKKEQKGDAGNDDIPDKKEAKNKNKQESKHDSHQEEKQDNSQKTPSRQGSDEEAEKQEEQSRAHAARESTGSENEAMKARALGAILDKLADDEAQLQKSLTTGRTKQAAPGQKLW